MHDASLENEIRFVIDGDILDDQDRPCGWNWTPWHDWNGVYHAGFNCRQRVVYRILTDFSDGRKTTSYYCEEHAGGAHSDVYKRSLIYHATLCWTRIVDLRTDTMCQCVKGDECEPLLAWRKRKREEQET